MENVYNELRDDFVRLAENVKKDNATFASTLLNHYRQRLDDLSAVAHFLFTHEIISHYEYECLQDNERAIADVVRERMQDRLYWTARRLDEYKKEMPETYTTGVIIANVYNDLFSDSKTLDATGKRSFNGERKTVNYTIRETDEHAFEYFLRNSPGAARPYVCFTTGDGHNETDAEYYEQRTRQAVAGDNIDAETLETYKRVFERYYKGIDGTIAVYVEQL